MAVDDVTVWSFRAVLFRMVPKPNGITRTLDLRFRAVLFRMVPKLGNSDDLEHQCFRAVLFRMVPKLRQLRMNVT